MTRSCRWSAVLAAAALVACDLGAPPASPAQQGHADPARAPIGDSAFAALVARVSEQGGFFDTDNLISNESGYLKVLGALDRAGVRGGAYVGVGPDQNFSYIARIRPEIAFIIDVRRDNMLHHLLLRALIERAPTRVEFLAGLHGRAPPPEPAAWTGRSVAEVVEYIDRAPAADLVALRDDVGSRIASYGVRLDEEDRSTIERFHQAFIDAGMSLRFTSYGRPPRPYYPTYRQLVAETDLDGVPASYLASAEAYAAVRELELAGRVIPVVGDLAGDHAVREIAAVLEEMGLTLSAIYASNVEFYLWREGTFPRWMRNLSAIPASADALVIRSYFPNLGAAHPSAVPGYFATQTLQPVATLLAGEFGSYWDVVTRGIVPLR